MPQRVKQTSEAQRLGDEARVVGLRCLAVSTLFLAKAAVSEQSGYGESVAAGTSSVQAIRSSPQFRKALDDDMVASFSAVEEILLEAMEVALDHEMRHLQTAIKGLSFKMTDEDRMLINGYPIHGHTAREVSKFIHDGLRYEVDGALVGPIVGDSTANTMPQDLGGIVQRFADRVSGAAQEAYFAGLQLAARLTAEAIANAR